MADLGGWNIYKDGKLIFTVTTYKQAINFITVSKMHETDGKDHKYDIRID